MKTEVEQIELLKKVAEDVEYIKRVLSESCYTWWVTGDSVLEKKSLGSYLESWVLT